SSFMHLILCIYCSNVKIGTTKTRIAKI
uniref:Uncharacterized protein n=1 Tax=Amphimedon queenslandica TaxID=400682 RepID=A0A1X7TEY5_AMPQE